MKPCEKCIFAFAIPSSKHFPCNECAEYGSYFTENTEENRQNFDVLLDKYKRGNEE